MIELTNRTNGASFTYNDEAGHKVIGSYIADDSRKLTTLNASLYTDAIYKGNSYLENGELRFTFQNVSVADIPGLVKAMEECKAEIEELL